MAKDPIIMVMVESISRIITMTGIMSRITGAMIIQGILNMAEATTMKIETRIVSTITLTIEAINSDLLVNKR